MAKRTDARPRGASVDRASDARRRSRSRGRGRSRRARRRRLVRRTALAILGLAAVLGAITVVVALRLQSQLLDARGAMMSARVALVLGDADAAESDFAQAEAAFRLADVAASNPVLRLVGLLPLIGRTPDVATALVDAGQLTAAAGRVIADGLDRLPGGLTALAPVRGRLPLEPLERLAAPFAEASRLLDEANALVAETPSSWLIGPVGAARWEFAGLLQETARTVRVAALLTRALPPFLGADGARSHFLGAQTPAELRGSGGLIGSYSILEVDEGQLEIGPFRPTQELRRVPVDDIPAPSDDYAEIYDRFKSRGFWPNVNMTPDLPTAATAIETLYAADSGRSVDGTILVDPFALEALLEVAGRVEVPSLGVTLTADNVVPYVLNRAYGRLSSEERKRVLGEAAREVLQRFLHGESDAGRREREGAGGLGGALQLAAAARNLAQATTEGHVLLHSTDPEIQAAFEEAGIAGSFGAPSGDFLGVVGNNAAENKADFYLDRSIAYGAQLADDGSAVGSATVTLTNNAPTEGVSSYVIGPNDPRFEAGENVTIVSTYCAVTCEIHGLSEDGRPGRIIGSDLAERGHPLLASFVEMPSGESGRLDYSWVVRDAWVEERAGSVYRLTYRGQPTIRPTSLRIEVTTPPGTEVSRASEGMVVDGNRAVWDGEAGDEMTFEVWFDWTLLGRISRLFTSSAPDTSALRLEGDIATIRNGIPPHSGPGAR